MPPISRLDGGRLSDRVGVLPIGGYVLAGGRSSRMGTDKALLKLADKPLVEHAVVKLRRICADAHILSANPALAGYAPLVGDLHPGCGPMSGIEAALAHSRYDWNVILPVDVPFLPTALLGWWVRETLGSPTALTESNPTRIALFRVDGEVQPAVLLIHRQARAFLTGALTRGELKLMPALMGAARELGQVGWPGSTLALCDLEAVAFPEEEDADALGGEGWRKLTAAQIAARPLWFANLNSPDDLAEAADNIAALDT
jgi:molybdopterin-guanine dinucleotide biosynthesis protein A